MCVFGLRPDLEILRKQKYYKNTSDLGSSYELPEGKDKDWFTGSSNDFEVIEIEVYAVRFL